MNNINDMSEKKQISIVRRNGLNIRYIKSPSLAVQLAAVNYSGNLIEYIDNPSEEVQLAAINSNPGAIRFIDYPTEKVQKYLIDMNVGWIIRIKNQTDYVKNYTLTNDGSLLPYVENLNSEIINKHKSSIIKAILTMIKNGNIYNDLFGDIFQILEQYNIKWSELDIINRSLDADFKN